MAAVQSDAVTDRDFVFQDGGKFAGARMQHTIVLHVSAIADAYVEHVPARDRAEPDRSLLANVHVADHLGAVSNESCRMNLRMCAAKRTNHIGSDYLHPR